MKKKEKDDTSKPLHWKYANEEERSLILNINEEIKNANADRDERMKALNAEKKTQLHQESLPRPETMEHCSQKQQNKIHLCTKNQHRGRQYRQNHDTEKTYWLNDK